MIHTLLGSSNANDGTGVRGTGWIIKNRINHGISHTSMVWIWSFMVRRVFGGGQQ
ncbi:hypothetical protein PSI23_21225 [Xenorhabdus sp. XENO-10]|uniref:Uncharacterized protein n=1 Tax=Xenorhabdus yunnanensis TaxID=3025878 RepID=A0ABT5LKT0_9GAMM|nr:hypothetical protein [Xenorhabdus yunnanensis]MDC9591732.1 hypothetical protein [Xenorhabdus yunnanensis]